MSCSHDSTLKFQLIRSISIGPIFYRDPCHLFLSLFLFGHEWKHKIIDQFFSKDSLSFNLLSHRWGSLCTLYTKLLQSQSLRVAWGQETSSEAAGVLVEAASSQGTNPNPPRGTGWSWLYCDCHKDPLSDQTPILPSSTHQRCLNYSYYLMAG